jgi:hypothetical protein
VDSLKEKYKRKQFVSAGNIKKSPLNAGNKSNRTPSKTSNFESKLAYVGKKQPSGRRNASPTGRAGISKLAYKGSKKKEGKRSPRKKGQGKKEKGVKMSKALAEDLKEDKELEDFLKKKETEDKEEFGELMSAHDNILKMAMASLSYNDGGGASYGGKRRETGGSKLSQARVAAKKSVNREKKRVQKVGKGVRSKGTGKNSSIGYVGKIGNFGMNRSRREKVKEEKKEESEKMRGTQDQEVSDRQTFQEIETIPAFSDKLDEEPLDQPEEIEPQVEEQPEKLPMQRQPKRQPKKRTGNFGNASHIKQGMFSNQRGMYSMQSVKSPKARKPITSKYSSINKINRSPVQRNRRPRTNALPKPARTTTNKSAYGTRPTGQAKSINKKKRTSRYNKRYIGKKTFIGRVQIHQNIPSDDPSSQLQQELVYSKLAQNSSRPSSVKELPDESQDPKKKRVKTADAKKKASKLDTKLLESYVNQPHLFSNLHIVNSNVYFPVINQNNQIAEDLLESEVQAPEETQEEEDEEPPEEKESVMQSRAAKRKKRRAKTKDSRRYMRSMEHRRERKDKKRLEKILGEKKMKELERKKSEKKVNAFLEMSRHQELNPFDMSLLTQGQVDDDMTLGSRKSHYEKGKKQKRRFKSAEKVTRRKGGRWTKSPKKTLEKGAEDLDEVKFEVSSMDWEDNKRILKRSKRPVNL